MHRRIIILLGPLIHMRIIPSLFAIVFWCIGCERNDPMKVTMVARDPQLEAASAEARSSITNFITALRSPAANQSNFVICVEFTSGHAMEAVWIGYLRYGEKGFDGLVATAPKSIPRLTNNQPVQMPLSRVIDWAYMEDDRLIGGFAERVRRSRMSESDRQSYDARLPYRIE